MKRPFLGCYSASEKAILIFFFLNMFKNLENCSSSLAATSERMGLAACKLEPLLSFSDHPLQLVAFAIPLLFSFL